MQNDSVVADTVLSAETEARNINVLPAETEARNINVLSAETEARNINVLPAETEARNINVLPAETEARNINVLPAETEASNIDVLPAEQATSIQEDRMNRVQDYQLGALMKSDLLEANIGSINGGLMRICVSMDDAIHRAMTAGPVTVERIQKMLPAVDVQLRLARQIDRFAQLELRTTATRKTKPDALLPPPRPR